MHQKALRLTLGAAALAWAADAASAQPVPRGDEILVDAPQAALSLTYAPLIAGKLDGTALLLYPRFRFTVDPFGADIVSRLLPATHDPLPPEQVLEKLSDFNGNNVVGLAGTPTGFTAVWTRPGPHPPYIAASLDEGGVPTSTVNVGRPALIVDPLPIGGFVAAWVGGRGSKKLSLQRLDSNGVAVAPAVQLRVPSETVLYTEAHAADGSFVVVWEPRYVIGRGIFQDLMAQRFDAVGELKGQPFVVFPRPSADEIDARVALGEDGTLAVLSDSSSNGLVSLSTYDASGRLVGGPLVISTSRGPTYAAESVAVDPNGNVLAVWASAEEAPGARARVFSRTGVPQGDEFIFSTAASASHPIILAASAGWAGNDWVIAWTASETAVGDDTRQVWVRRFAR